jgi:glycosyltransferase involved in cell wall biosynthesis
MDSKTEKSALSIVIPVYNSKDTIEPLIDELVNYLQNNHKLEIILVNDDSRDNSEEICIGLHRRYSEIVSFISLSRNVGEHNAVMAGLNHVTGDYTVIMDDDFQNPISEVIKMVDFIKNSSFDVVYSYYEKKKHSFFRNWGSNFNNSVANIMLKKPKDLYLSSFKVLNKFTVTEVIKYTDPFPYIDGLILRVTSKIGKIKVIHHERKTGQSGYTLKKLVFLWSNMFVNFSILPLRVSVFLGFIFAIIGFIFGIKTIIEKIMNPDIPQGYPSMIVVISIFAGIQLISIGMIGEYLGRLFLSQNKQPQYTIRKRFERKEAKVESPTTE